MNSYANAPLPVKFLDPKNDVVFKMLFVDEHHNNILRDFLSSVLKKDVLEATVQNPSIPRNVVDEREIVVDVAVKTGEGEHVDVEMQVANHDHFRERCLYYWARMHSRQLKRGDRNYKKLRATHSILVLNFELLKCPKLAAVYHSLVEAKVRGSDEIFSPHFQMHIIELPKLAKCKNVSLAQDGVARWGRFMLQPTAETLTELGVFSPVFEEVKEVMANMSASQRAQHLADQRQKGRLDQQQREDDAEARGEAQGDRNRARSAAQAMLKKGLSRTDVAEILQMTESELNDMLAPAP